MLGASVSLQFCMHVAFGEVLRESETETFTRFSDCIITERTDVNLMNLVELG